MKDEIYLVCDVLDSQLVDSNDQPMGRADGLVLEWRGDIPPRVAAIEVGAGVLAARMKSPAGNWLLKLAKSRSVWGGSGFRVPFEKARECGLKIELDLKREETPALDYEHLLRERIVCRIPGSG